MKDKTVYIVSGCRAHKSMMLVFAHIDTDNQVLIRSGDLFDNLTMLLASDNLLITHNNLLLASFWVLDLATLCYQEVIYLQGDNNFFSCHAGGYNLLLF
jgi:hypothetical protein